MVPGYWGHQPWVQATWLWLPAQEHRKRPKQCGLQQSTGKIVQSGKKRQIFNSEMGVDVICFIIMQSMYFTCCLCWREVRWLTQGHLKWPIRETQIFWLTSVLAGAIRSPAQRNGSESNMMYFCESSQCSEMGQLLRCSVWPLFTILVNFLLSLWSQCR